MGSAGAFTPSAPTDLAWPKEGSTTLRAVYSMAVRKLFEDLKSLRPAGLSADVSDDYRALREVFAGFLPGNPGAIASLLRHPVVSGPLRCLRDGVCDPSSAATELVAQSLFRLSNVGALEQPVRIRSLPPMLLDPWARLHLELAEEAVLFGDREIRAGEERLPKQRGKYAPLFGSAVFAHVDNNPLRSVETHPEKWGSEVDLGGKSLGDWLSALNEAAALVAEHAPVLYKELELVLSQIVPVGVDSERHFSASYREVPGTIYLSLHPDPLTMAEALIHEHSHTKLNLMLELDPVLDNPGGEHASPYRPDPRPLMGVLLAVHAFVPVQRFYERLVASGGGGARRLDVVRERNVAGAKLLKEHALPTSVGRGIVDELVRATEVAEA